MQTNLRTQRLTLRPPQADDATWIAAEIAHPEVQVMLTTPPHPYRLTDAEAWLARQTPGQGNFVMLEGDRPLGVVGLGSPGHERELGFWLRRDAWGRGVMTEAATAVLDWHFARSDDPVVSGHIVDNPASGRVQTKLGFVQTHVLQRRCHFRATEVDIQRTMLTPQRWCSGTA